MIFGMWEKILWSYFIFIFQPFDLQTKFLLKNKYNLRIDKNVVWTHLEKKNSNRLWYPWSFHGIQFDKAGRKRIVSSNRHFYWVTIQRISLRIIGETLISWSQMAALYFASSATIVCLIGNQKLCCVYN